MAEPKTYERTTAGLRALLFDTIVAVKGGAISAKEATSVAQVSREIISTLDIELRAQKQAKEMGGESDALVLAPPTIKLVGHEAQA